MLTVLLTLLTLGSPSQVKEQKVVLVFGDSLAAGTGLPIDQRDGVWVRLVEEQSHGRLWMVNESQGGRWTRALREYELTLDRQPGIDLLIIALGTNDSGDNSADSVSLATMNLQTMIYQGRKKYGRDLPLLIVGPPSMNPQALKGSADQSHARIERLRKLNQAFSDLALAEGCFFVSLFGIVPDDSMVSDGMHPDVRGNEIIARFLLPAINSAVGH